MIGQVVRVRTKHDIVEQITEQGAVAVVRIEDGGAMLWLTDILRAACVESIEVTLTVPNALDHVRRLVDYVGPGHLVGVGSVCTVKDAERAMDAGAVYVVSPVFREDVVRAAVERGVAVMPGCLTPSEIYAAHEAGADVVKVFPADAVGMPFIKAVRAPMPQLRLMPTGGVTCENAGDWIRSGAVAVGVGSALVSGRAVADRDGETITRRAAALMQSIRSARGEHSEGA